MPTLIRGDRLLPEARAEVLAAFGYRWTVENESRAREWSGPYPPETRPAMRSDAEWLREHSFYVNRDGSLSCGKWRSAGHWTQAPDPRCACCGFTLRPQDHANPIPGTATFKCDMCVHRRGICCEERCP